MAYAPQAAKLPGHKLRLPLHYAVLAEDEAMVKHCCEINHDSEVINARDNDGKTPWMMASEHHEQNILDILSEYSPEKTMSNGR